MTSLLMHIVVSRNTAQILKLPATWFLQSRVCYSVQYGLRSARNEITLPVLRQIYLYNKALARRLVVLQSHHTVAFNQSMEFRRSFNVIDFLPYEQLTLIN
jgi:hypothetical protein